MFNVKGQKYVFFFNIRVYITWNCVFHLEADPPLVSDPPPMSDPSVSTTTQTTTKSAIDRTNSFLETQSGIATIAGAAGGLAMLSIFICIVFIVILMNFKKKRERQINAYKCPEDMYVNALYEGGKTDNFHN